MMRYSHLYIVCICLFSQAIWAQSTIDSALETYNEQSVPYISVQELYENPSTYLLLDTRKKEEYEVSHLPGAVWVGEQLKDSDFAQRYTDKTQPIVVYCSIGVRSEDFGESLKKEGYKQVKNLYGSLFAWKNHGYDVVNTQGVPTDSIHAFDKDWGKLLKKGIKVYQ